MKILLDYNKDRNNGLSTISSLPIQTVREWGEPASNDEYMLIPLQISSDLADNESPESAWKILSYKYSSLLSGWIGDDSFSCPSASVYPIRVDINTDNSYMAILNNSTSQCHIYKIDQFGKWGLSHTLSIPVASPNLGVKKISMDNGYLCISDWNYGTAGTIWVYELNKIIDQYELSTTITAPLSSVRFGSDISFKQERLFVGDPYFTTASSRDGKFYIYRTSDWTSIYDAVGEAFFHGLFANTIDAHYDSGTTSYRVLIGAPGVNNERGRIYFYHEAVGVWSLNTQLDAPPGYQIDGNMFGSRVSIRGDYAIVAAIEEAAEAGAVYIYKYGGVAWAVDVLDGTVDPARFTGGASSNFFGLYARTFLAMEQYGDGYTYTRAAAGWGTTKFITASNLYIKKTVDESFYHNAIENQTVEFKLEVPISGIYRMQLNMIDALRTIGAHNDTIYFSIDAVFGQAVLDHGDYTGAELATHIKERMDAVFPGVSFFVRYEAGVKKYTIASSNALFAFGSDQQSSLRDSCQNKTLGFYDNDYAIIHALYGSDRQAILDTPSTIGVNVLEGYGTNVIKNNSVFAEVHTMATLDAGVFKILESENQYIRIPDKTSRLTLLFPCLDGGAFMNINTNNIQLILDNN